MMREQALMMVIITFLILIQASGSIVSLDLPKPQPTPMLEVPSGPWTGSGADTEQSKRRTFYWLHESNAKPFQTGST